MGFCWSLEDATVGEGFARIFAAQLKRAIATIDDADEPAPRRIHAVRRRAKRLRGLLRIVRPDLPGYRLLNHRIRDAANELSAMRDAAVLQETLAELCRWSGHPPPARPEDTPDEDETRRLAHFRRAFVELADDLPHLKTDKLDPGTIAHGMADEYKAGRTAMRACIDDPGRDDAMHEWRKHVKYLSFHLLLLRHPLPDAGDQIDRAESLASILGRHHDLSVLRLALADRPEELADDLDVDFLRYHARQRQNRLAAHAFRIGAPLFARHPKDLRHGLLARWDSWQNSQRDAA